jgi:hypothetical protein
VAGRARRRDAPVASDRGNGRLTSGPNATQYLFLFIKMNFKSMQI